MKSRGLRGGERIVFAEDLPEYSNLSEYAPGHTRVEDIVSTQFLRFQISTFEKLRFPRSLILALELPYLRSPLYLYPLQRSHQDEHGQEDKN